MTPPWILRWPTWNVAAWNRFSFHCSGAHVAVMARQGVVVRNPTPRCLPPMAETEPDFGGTGAPICTWKPVWLNFSSDENLLTPGLVRCVSLTAHMVPPASDGMWRKRWPFPMRPLGLMHPIWWRQGCSPGPGLAASPMRNPRNIIANQKSLQPQKFARNLDPNGGLDPSHSPARRFIKRLSMRFIWSSNLWSRTAPRLWDWWSILVSRFCSCCWTCWFCCCCPCWNVDMFADICSICCSKLVTRASTEACVGASSGVSRARSLRSRLASMDVTCPTASSLLRLPVFHGS